MSYVPGAPIASPVDSRGSGEPFPCRERQPRHRKSENPDNSRKGLSLPQAKHSKSEAARMVPAGFVRPGYPLQLRSKPKSHSLGLVAHAG